MPSSATRTESDSFGPIEVPADAYWGAQTAPNEQGRLSLRARILKAQEEMEQEQHFISLHEARKPRWVVKEQAAR